MIRQALKEAPLEAEFVKPTRRKPPHPRWYTVINNESFSWLPGDCTHSRLGIAHLGSRYARLARTGRTGIIRLNDSPPEIGISGDKEFRDRIPG